MQKLVKYLVSVTVRPALAQYLKETRTYRYRNITLQVPPEVFHPGFFFSTKMLLRYVCALPLRGRSVLELGAGSGLISIAAAQQGATVTASELNTKALIQLADNADANNVSLRIVHSDLFESMPGGSFDIIAVNPPYYKKEPGNERELAWYCGAKGQYFQRFFAQLKNHIHKDSEVLMVLSSDCDLDGVRLSAALNHFRLRCVQRRANLMETLFIFKIEADDADE